jgi:hypothetical protein
MSDQIRLIPPKNIEFDEIGPPSPQASFNHPMNRFRWGSLEPGRFVGGVAIESPNESMEWPSIGSDITTGGQGEGDDRSR